MLRPTLNLKVEHVALITTKVIVVLVVFFPTLHRSQSLISGYSRERGFSMATTEELMLK